MPSCFNWQPAWNTRRPERTCWGRISQSSLLGWAIMEEREICVGDFGF